MTTTFGRVGYDPKRKTSYLIGGSDSRRKIGKETFDDYSIKIEAPLSNSYFMNLAGESDLYAELFMDIQQINLKKRIKSKKTLKKYLDQRKDINLVNNKDRFFSYIAGFKGYFGYKLFEYFKNEKGVWKMEEVDGTVTRGSGWEPAMNHFDRVFGEDHDIPLDDLLPQSIEALKKSAEDDPNTGGFANIVILSNSGIEILPFCQKISSEIFSSDNQYIQIKKEENYLFKNKNKTIESIVRYNLKEIAQEFLEEKRIKLDKEQRIILETLVS